MAKYALNEESSQQKYPWRATVRTVLAYVVAFLAAMAVALPVLNDQLGIYLTDHGKGVLAWLAGLCGALVATITRIMALPAVDKFLTMLGLGSTPGE